MTHHRALLHLAATCVQHAAQRHAPGWFLLTTVAAIGNIALGADGLALVWLVACLAGWALRTMTDAAATFVAVYDFANDDAAAPDQG